MRRLLLLSLLASSACASRTPVTQAAATPATATPPPTATTTTTTTADRLREAALAGRSFELVRSLTDEVGPRFSGTPGDAAAVAWAQRTMTDLGLTDVRAERVMVPRWERGEEGGRLLTPHPRTLSLTALLGSIGTPAAGIEAEVLLVESVDALELLDASAVRGKLVFLPVKMPRTRDGSGYSIAMGLRGRAPILAARLGAAGLLIRSVATGPERFPHTGLMRNPPERPVPTAALAAPDADMLERLIRGGAKPRVHLRLGAHTRPDVASANVIGEVRGRTRPDEIVVLAAHLDTVDIGPGAQDDASGCAVVLEAARLLAALPEPPARTVRVVLFANEENGLRGAEAYVREHAAELSRHAFGLEMDYGAGRVFETHFAGGPELQPLVAEVGRLLAPLGVTAGVAEVEGLGELFPLLMAGMPGVELRQDATAYFDIHHTANDTLDKIVRADLEQVAAAVTLVAYAAANAEHDLGRVPEARRPKP